MATTPKPPAPNAIDERIKLLTRFSFRGPITAFIMVAGFGFLYTLMFVKVPLENKGSLDTAQGFVLVIMTIAANWLYGSSKSESDKNKAETVKDIITKDQNTPLPE